MLLERTWLLFCPEVGEHDHALSPRSDARENVPGWAQGGRGGGLERLSPPADGGSQAQAGAVEDEVALGAQRGGDRETFPGLRACGSLDDRFHGTAVFLTWNDPRSGRPAVAEESPTITR